MCSESHTRQCNDIWNIHNSRKLWLTFVRSFHWPVATTSLPSMGDDGHYFSLTPYIAKAKNGAKELKIFYDPEQKNNQPQTGLTHDIKGAYTCERLSSGQPSEMKFTGTQCPVVNEVTSLKGLQGGLYLLSNKDQESDSHLILLSNNKIMAAGSYWEQQWSKEYLKVKKEAQELPASPADSVPPSGSEPRRDQPSNTLTGVESVCSSFQNENLRFACRNAVSKKERVLLQSMDRWFKPESRITQYVSHNDQYLVPETFDKQTTMFQDLPNERIDIHIEMLLKYPILQKKTSGHQALLLTGLISQNDTPILDSKTYHPLYALLSSNTNNLFTNTLECFIEKILRNQDTTIAPQLLMFPAWASVGSSWELLFTIRTLVRSHSPAPDKINVLAFEAGHRPLFIMSFEGKEGLTKKAITPIKNFLYVKSDSQYMGHTLMITPANDHARNEHILIQFNPRYTLVGSCPVRDKKPDSDGFVVPDLSGL